MRLDRYLKVSRLIKRRVVAKELCDKKRVSINGRIASPSSQIKLDDVIKISFGTQEITVKILKIIESTKKEDAYLMYELLSQNKIEETVE